MRTVVVTMVLLLVATSAMSQFRAPSMAEIDRVAAENRLLAAQAQQAEVQNQIAAEQLRNLRLQNARLEAPCPQQ